MEAFYNGDKNTRIMQMDYSNKHKFSMCLKKNPNNKQIRLCCSVSLLSILGSAPPFRSSVRSSQHSRNIIQGFCKKLPRVSTEAALLQVRLQSGSLGTVDRWRLSDMSGVFYGSQRITIVSTVGWTMADTLQRYWIGTAWGWKGYAITGEGISPAYRRVWVFAVSKNVHSPKGS